MPTLSAYNVASLRMLVAGLVMLPFAIKVYKRTPKHALKYMLLSGWMGSFFAAYLFCIAETKIDSSLAGCLNSLTPLFVIVTGLLLFKVKTNTQKIIGVIIGLLGCCMLCYVNLSKSAGYVAYGLYIILATCCYGVNVNIVS
jgi:drug/metabolite transporter (DMT)-like permease